MGLAQLVPATGLILPRGPRSRGSQSAIQRRTQQMQSRCLRVSPRAAAGIPEGCQLSARTSSSWVRRDTPWLLHIHFKHLFLK